MNFDLTERFASISRVSAYLQTAEPLCLVTGDLCIDKFGEEELSKQGTLEDESQIKYLHWVNT